MKVYKKHLYIVLVWGIFFSAIIGITLFITHTFAFAQQDNDEFIEWPDPNTLPTSNGNYKLTTDVTLPNIWHVPSGETKLDLNSFNITWNGVDYDNASVIYVDDTSEFHLYDNSTEHNGTITGGYGYYDSNLELSLGGGILVTGGNFYMHGGNISGNYASAGAGVYIYEGSMVLSGGSITNNVASYYGGGVAVEYGDFEMTDGQISNNEAFYSYDYSSWGGGIYYSFGKSQGLNLTGGIISNNFTGKSGGGVFCWTETSALIDGVTISDNGAGVYGGGMYIYGSYDQITSAIMKSGLITQNWTYYDGGGVAVVNEGDGNAESYSNFYFKGGTISSNIADSDNTGEWCGGGIYNYCAYVEVTGGNIENNEAGYGGGLFNDYANCEVNDGLLSGNKAITGGAGVGNLNSNFTLNDGLIDGNQILGTEGYHCGGGIYNYDSYFVMNGGTVSNNTAKTGGGIESDYNKTELLSGTISYNTAQYGGGFNNYACEAIIENCNFIGNNATIYGGGIFNDFEDIEEMFIEGSLIVKTGTFQLNSAPEGAAIYNKTVIQILGANITNNTCTKQDFAIVESRDYPLYLDGTTITNNNGKGAWCLHNKLILNGRVNISNNFTTQQNIADIVKYADSDEYVVIGENFYPVNKISVMIVKDAEDANGDTHLIETQGRLTNGYKEAAPESDLDTYFEYNGKINQLAWGSKDKAGESKDEIWLVEKTNPDNPTEDPEFITTQTGDNTTIYILVVFLIFAISQIIFWKKLIINIK